MNTSQALAADTGTTTRIGQPGFYGELYFGAHYPKPQLVYPEPILVWQTPANLLQPPIYLHVPRGHIKNWHKSCRKYRACNQAVYFVQESWYNNVYIPYYQSHNSYDNDHGQE